MTRRSASPTATRWRVHGEAERSERTQAETKRRSRRVLATDMAAVFSTCDPGRSSLCAASDGEIDIHLATSSGRRCACESARRALPESNSLEVLARISTPLPDTFTADRRRAALSQAVLDLLMNEESRNERCFGRRRLRRSAILDEWGSSRWRRRAPATLRRCVRKAVRHALDASTRTVTSHRDRALLKRLIVGGLEKVYEIGKDSATRSLVQASPSSRCSDGRSVRRLPHTTGSDRAARFTDRQEVLGTTKVTFKGQEMTSPLRGRA